jgi:hypothetical protein
VAKAVGVSGLIRIAAYANRGDARIIMSRKSSTRAKPCWQKETARQGAREQIF